MDRVITVKSNFTPYIFGGIILYKLYNIVNKPEKKKSNKIKKLNFNIK